jgi:L-alanine-DL-glutamate epimerase-like enolase superfamily enzyme
MAGTKLFITGITLYKAPIRLKEPFKISLGSFYYAENVLIKISTNEGITGYGECSPFLTIQGENADTCMVIGKQLAKLLVKKDPLDIITCHQLMNAYTYANTSIKSAFDMALYDIASQQANLPLYRFLKGRSKIFVTDYTVSIGDPAKMAKDAEEIIKRGFQIIKVKLGGTKHEDIQRIKEIRKTIGYDIPIRIDVNQAWNTQTAPDILKALSKFNIQFCEEPIPKWDFLNLPAITKDSPIPIMADESCCNSHEAQRLIDIKACNYFNIKLGKSSGIFNALKLIKLADKAGIKMQFGGFLESRLGFTAAAHTATVSNNIIFFDFDTPLMHAEDIVEGGIVYCKNGQIDLLDKTGLGAGINSKFLKKLEDKITVK